MRYGDIILSAAREHQVEVGLLASIIKIESDGEPLAIRYEAKFFGKYIKPYTLHELPGYHPKVCSNITEKYLRSCSFGLCQVMGNTARIYGFRGEWLTQLLDPAANVPIGAKILRDMVDKTETLEEALLRWNGGSNKKYPDKVLKIREAGEWHALMV
jgi:soluble lytic murein transglycosylase-like protein